VRISVGLRVMDGVMDRVGVAEPPATTPTGAVFARDRCGGPEAVIRRSARSASMVLMNRTPHMMTSKIGMTKSMSRAVHGKEVLLITRDDGPRVYGLVSFSLSRSLGVQLTT
jgi:hypothetical protein